MVSWLYLKLYWIKDKMKIEVTDNGRIRVITAIAPDIKYGPSMTPEEAVKFGTELINKAYPLTKAVRKKTNPPQLYREPKFGTPDGYTPGHCATGGFAADYFIYWRNK